MINIEKQFEKAEKIFVPKGENKKAVAAFLAENGVVLPEFSGRCLHLV